MPVNMFIAVDRSGSMGNQNKWENARAAFTSFFQDPDADSLNVALRFWPDNNQCQDPACSIDGCSVPDVPLGSLADTAHEQALVSAFNSTGPDGFTPMWAALGGATKWALDRQVANEGLERNVVILLSDGAPNDCGSDVSAIAQHATDAYNQAEILTFSVGLEGSNEQVMNTIAAAGQTQMAFFIGNANAEAELLAALKAIQDSVVACTFAMPQSTDPTNPVDPTQVNITFTPSGSQATQTIFQVANEGGCGSAGGWYYDDPVNPAIITLCPDTCNSVQADENGKIEIVLGCGTQAA
jgi:hypothetical protein